MFKIAALLILLLDVTKNVDKNETTIDPKSIEEKSNLKGVVNFSDGALSVGRKKASFH